ncbi:MAG: DNA polymerase, partial [Solirubrobacteraceae bacterium]
MSRAGERQPDRLPVALRAWTETPAPDKRKRKSKRKRQPGGRDQRQDKYVLVLDTETTIDRSQRLNFGVYRYYRTRRSGGKLYCVDEGIFHADELPERDPAGYRLLCSYAKYGEPAVDCKPGDPLPADAPVQIRLLSEAGMRELLYRAAWKNRALVVCFNLPFDLSRLAIGWAETRGGKTRGQQRASSFAGGFTLRYFEHDGRPNSFRPELQIKTIDSKRALKRFNIPYKIDQSDRDGNGRPFRGHLLDLRTIAFALTARGHTLQSACAAFGVSYRDVLGDDGCERRGIPLENCGQPYEKQEAEHGNITGEYIDYCRDDVAATGKLYEAVAAEYRRHPIDLPITGAYSPASLSKAYPEAMGVKPRLEVQPDFPRDLLGWAMSAYYGGRAECRIRRTPVPVVYLDFLSMYPTVNALMGLWDHVTAARIEVAGATDEIRQRVDRIDLEACLRRELWRELPALVQIKPCGDVLPLRAPYGNTRSWWIGSNPLWSDEPMWFGLADVLGSKLITGRAPEILRGLRFVPDGCQRGISPVRLRGRVQIDPRADDLFRAAIEQRRLLKEGKNSAMGRFLKTFANAASYGIYAEMTRRELPAGQRQDVTVHGLDDDPFPASVSAPEQPGRLSFPPMAATITAAARLMLAILETLVTEQGGIWAFCDTDSMAVVSTQNGGLVPCPGGPEQDHDGRECVRALPLAQVDQIVSKFEALNPYDRSIVPGSVLEIEEENHDLDLADPEHERVLKDTRRQLHCYAISAKHYALDNLTEDGQPILRKTAEDPDDQHDGPADDDEPDDVLDGLRKHSEHGLGHLLNPTDPESQSRHWIAETWRHILATDAHGQPVEPQTAARKRSNAARGKRPAANRGAVEPVWLDQPALTKTTITSPR